jgi:hypothetical protein
VIPDVESRIVCVDVPCLTLESLCRKHGVEQLDLLLTDTEGYDGEILRQINFSRRRPRLLIYEHYHLAPAERSACRALVEGHGYETMEEGFDTWCLDTVIDDSTTHRWRRLRPGVPGVSVHDEAS